MNRHTGRNINRNEHIKQSIEDILTTPIGTRIQRREYGSYLHELIDKPISKALVLQVAVASVIALKRWEPRIDVTRFAVNTNPESARMTAEMDCIIKDENQKINIKDIKIGK